jgi:hypothetical protein
MLISPLRGTSTIAKAFCVGIMKAVHWTAVFWLVCRAAFFFLLIDNQHK